VAYYSQRLYDQAEECFKVIRMRDPYRTQHIDTYSNILYVKEKMADLSALAHSVVEVSYSCSFSFNFFLVSHVQFLFCFSE
jgi:hypothetical protein